MHLKEASSQGGSALRGFPRLRREIRGKQVDSAGVERPDTADRNGDPEKQSVQWVWGAMGQSHEHDVGWDALGWSVGVLHKAGVFGSGNLRCHTTIELAVVHDWMARSWPWIRANNQSVEKWEEDTTSEWTDAANRR